MTFRELIDSYSLTPPKAAKFFGVSTNTARGWYSGKYQCRPFILSLMEYKLMHEKERFFEPVSDEPRFSSACPDSARRRIVKLTDEELIQEITTLPTWDEHLLRELCWRGGTLESFLCFEDFDCPPVYEAAFNLGYDLERR